MLCFLRKHLSGEALSLLLRSSPAPNRPVFRPSQPLWCPPGRWEGGCGCTAGGTNPPSPDSPATEDGRPPRAGARFSRERLRAEGAERRAEGAEREGPLPAGEGGGAPRWRRQRSVAACPSPRGGSGSGAWAGRGSAGRALPPARLPLGRVPSSRLSSPLPRGPAAGDAPGPLGQRLRPPSGSLSGLSAPPRPCFSPLRCGRRR